MNVASTFELKGFRQENLLCTNQTVHKPRENNLRTSKPIFGCKNIATSSKRFAVSMCFLS